ncbi:hypothetical protein I4F81_009990 [Pyropia yezoensis]|uniref:Uncharacterized protein n=1 Tax=Pyropia yezoensis TaxID=2788 RepID=A0ACC3CCE4_PYRYE|nr:hypothetical protein I4F81_009990 [Neopyropia yezoensis]
MANDGDAHYFPLLRERSKASLLPGGASSSSRQAAVGFVVTTPSATGADSVTFLAATLEDAQQWVTAIQPWLLPWRDVVASAPACFPGRAWDGGASAVSEEALRVATTACTFAAGAVGAAGGVVKAFGHAMANHAELIRIGEAIPVAGPAFALLASIARQMHRYRGEAGAVAGVVESTAELISLAGTSLGLAVRDGRGGSTAMALEDVLMGVERAAVDIQCFCHSTSQRRKVLFSGAAGPKAIAERLESLRTRLISSCTVHTQQMVSLKSECAGATAPTPWEPPWPFVKGATHADAKMYKNSEVVAALANFFESAQGFSVGVLSGQAGVGKSEAAKCYMREQKGRFSGGVVLVNADDPSVAVKSLQFMSGLPPESVVGSTALKEYLRRNTVTHGRMLLVLDNADALGGADHWLSAWLPVRLVGRFLLRTGVDGVLVMHRLTQAVVRGIVFGGGTQRGLQVLLYRVVCSTVREGAVCEAADLLAPGDVDAGATEPPSRRSAEGCWGLVACQLPRFPSLLRARDLVAADVTAANEAPVSHYRRAALAGSADAKTHWAVLLQNGEGVAADAVAAVELYREAAAAGHVRAKFNLGVCLQRGEGVAADAVAAVELYREAAAAGDTEAKFHLGVCLQGGDGVAADAVAAVELYREAAAAGHVPAKLNLGAAAAGEMDAKLNLGVCLQRGDGVAADAVAAVELYREAAAAGEMDAKLNLGVCLQRGDGVAADAVAAVELYRESAAAGVVAAKHNFVVCLQRGEGVAADAVAAVELYREAAAAGDVAAKLDLGRGEGVAADAVAAVELYRESAAARVVAAKFNLGVCLQRVDGVAADVVAALQLYREAAAAGHVAAKHNLGVCLQLGGGAAADAVAAVELYRESAAAGHAGAVEMLWIVKGEEIVSSERGLRRRACDHCSYVELFACVRVLVCRRG